MKFGLTLFSLTNEWQTGRYSLSGLLEQVATENLGPALELVGAQSFRGFPDLGPADVATFRETVERLELEPTALGIFADLARHSDRLLTTDEVVDDLVRRFDAAVALGFPTLRIAIGLNEEVLERLTPHLERRGLTLTMELQGSTNPESPILVDTLAAFDRIQSEALGLTLDFSLYMPAIPATLVTYLERGGVGPATIAAFQAALATGQEGWSALVEAAEADGTGRDIVERCRVWLFRFGHTPPEQWRDVLPWVRHTHGKFWDLENPARDIVEPHGAFLRLLAEEDYTGAVASEWGGSDWLELDDADGFAMTAGYLDLLTSALPLDQ